MGLFALTKKSESPVKAISREDAIVQLMIFLNFYHIDLEANFAKLQKSGADVGNMTADDWGLELVRLIEDGNVSIEERDGVPKVTVHLTTPLGEINELVFGEIGLKQKRIVLSKNLNALAKGLCIMESVCEQTSALLDRIKGQDAKVLEDLTQLFSLA